MSFNTKPTIDNNPQPIAQLRDRYPQAVATVWDGDAIVSEAEGGSRDYDRPGRHPEHVFDFQSGIRLLVSREKYAEDGVILHVSASFFHDTLAGEQLEKAATYEKRISVFLTMTLAAWRDLTGKELAGEPSVIHHGVPHWIIHEEPDHASA